MSVDVDAADEELFEASFGNKRSLLQEVLQRSAQSLAMQQNALLCPYVLQYNTPMSRENERL